MPWGRREPRILGITESGKRITLVNSFVASGGFSIPGYEHEEYDAQILYRGAHLAGQALGVLLQAAFVSELGVPAELSLQLFGEYLRFVWAVRRADAQRQQPEEAR